VQWGVRKGYNKYDSNPPVHWQSEIPKCDEYRNEGDPCVTIGYGVIGDEKPWVTNVMKYVGQKYNLDYGTDIKN
jgi:hypothetical protein